MVGSAGAAWASMAQAMAERRVMGSFPAMIIGQKRTCDQWEKPTANAREAGEMLNSDLGFAAVGIEWYTTKPPH